LLDERRRVLNPTYSAQHVSKKHATITIYDDKAFITDNNSSTKTYLGARSKVNSKTENWKYSIVAVIADRT
jgi:pSer/pThr/pTyr-binding forkhead associated (FHA) protein